MSTHSMDWLCFEGSLTFQLVYLRGLLSVQKKRVLPDQAIKANPKISAGFSNDSIQECLFLPGK